MENKVLSISIPTFNRPAVLKKNILNMIKEVKDFSIPIYISDESNNEETKNIISEIKKDYKYIYYFKQFKKLGHDNNVFFSLKLPKTNYVWLLGDSTYLNKNSLKYIFDVINNHEPDIIGVNSELRKLDINNNIYKKYNDVLNDLAWHLTWTGVTIYSQKSISTIDEIDRDRYVNFPQIALIFTHLSKSCSFYWINHNMISSTKKDSSYWSQRIFQVWFEDWKKTIYNLPDVYNKKIKEKVYLDHARKTNLFNLKTILWMRSIDIYNFNSFRKYKKLLVLHSGFGVLTLMLILLIPKSILRIFKNLIIKIKNL